MDSNNQSNNQFAWTSFYMEFADKLLPYKNNRPQLLEMLKGIYVDLELRYPFTEKDGTPLDDICPFTVFGCFNKHISNENRIALVKAIGDKFGLKSTAPTEFDGIPVLSNINSWFFGDKSKRKEDDISNLWDMFEAGINYADNPSEASKSAFIACYDKVRGQYGIMWNLTIGLYWIRPLSYLNLDECNRSYLVQDNFPYYTSITKISSLKQLPSAEIYLELISACKEIFAKSDSPHHSFPELSYGAWVMATSKAQNKVTQSASPRRYWIYVPGGDSSKWDDLYSHGIMGIGCDELGDLKQYSSKDAIKAKMSDNDSALAAWHFANEIKVGDVVYAKRDEHKVIGRGTVESDYIFDADRDEYKHIRKVNWTHKGEWEDPGESDLKTLTDITTDTDYVQKLEALFINDNFVKIGEEIKEKGVEYDPYTEVDFLSEVFMDAERYRTLVNLLKTKKNIILQGAPGVGKTFVAKRLAFSIMGQKDTSRVMMVQFHQSYSYEDFVMGFRPSKDGFELTSGPFYQFCKAAQEDDERDYFFIIDEINRGNVSKIFGELLMLIEKEKRGEKLHLLYSNEPFSVPENVYIIGTMNTADRSLAIIDYALRRRFAFFELEPAFDSEGFKAIIQQANNPKFNALVEQIKSLNEFISNDESLGSGFRIGHSYLCANGEVTDEWLKAVVEYELLPLLDEYWFDEPSKIEQWEKKLKEALG